MNMQNGVIEEKPSLLLYDFDVVCGNNAFTDKDLPEEYMLPEDRIPTCRDQDWCNQCTCFAACNILEIIHYLKTGKRKLYSTTYMYGRHRGEHMRKMDCGSDQSLMKWLTMLGSIPYEDMPQLMANPEAYDYVRQQNLEELDRIASESAIDSYVGMNSADLNTRIPQIKKALMTYGYPLWITYRVTSSDKHAVALIGWNKENFIFMNSWGKNEKIGDTGIHKRKWDTLSKAYLFLFEENKPAFPFVDVKEEQWFYHAIHRCYNAGIINGIDKTHFAPDNVLTKAQVSQALYKMAQKHADFNGVKFTAVKPSISFIDVSKSQWFYDAVNYCVNKKIFVENIGEFEPEGCITRSEFCRIINAYIKAHCDTKKINKKLTQVQCNKLPFVDILKGEKLYEDILVCYALGIIKGVDNTHFMPNELLSRAHLCQMIYNLIKIIEDIEA